MRFRVACLLASISLILAVAGCGGSSGSNSQPTTPTITWATPAAITYGTPLSATQVNATASVPGTFTYSPASGAVLAAGQQTLSVSFTPTDTTKYTSATGSTTLTVNKAALSVTANSQSMSYGGTLPSLSGVLTGVVAGDGITASYSTTASSSSPAGTYPITAALSDPNTKLANYTVTNTPGTLTVGKAALIVTANSQSMSYGGTLPSLTGVLTGVVAGDGITASYSTTATSSSPAGTYPITAALNDPNSKLANYTLTNTPGTLTVNTAALSVTADNQSMGYGSTLPSLTGVLTGVVAGDGITASYSTIATSSSPVGNYPITAALSDPNTKLANYIVTNTPGTLTVSKATPAITWATPGPVAQGTALGATQLDATASNGAGATVPGAFVYLPASGTVLNTPGPVQLNTTFTPTDTANYTTATGSVSLIVNPPGVTVDFGAQAQYIRGFGGSTAWLGQLTQAQADALFSPTSGLGLSILRVRIDPTGPATNSYIPINGNWGQEAANGSAAVKSNPNAIVFASPWTPPASLKLSGSATFTDPGSSTKYNEAFSASCDRGPGYCGGYLDPAHYADYATYLNDFVTYFNANSSTPLYAISMQNEPDWTTGYESCIWSPLQMDTWIAANASVVTANTKLIMPESLNFNPVQALKALNNPNSENLISIIGGHLYGVNTIVPYSIPSGDSPKELWMTEFGPLNTNTPAFSDALTYAKSVHNSLVSGQYNAYVWWGIFGAPTNAGSYGLINSSGTNPVPTLYGYAIGQYSKFIQPGYYRYSATAKPSAAVYVSAYAGTPGGMQHYVIVAINSGTSAVSQPFTINNATVTSMTPYQTTATTGLVPQTAITVTGDAFTYTLPAQSITTFVQ